MNPCLEMLQRIHASPHFDKVRRAAAPLFDHFGINHFWYYRIDSKGGYTYVGTHGEWGEYCYEHSLVRYFPCLRHPKVLRRGVQLMKAYQNEQYQEVLDVAWKKFQINFHLNLFEICTDSVEAFGFASHFQDSLADERLLNELPLLQYFTKVFRQNNAPLFSFLESQQVDLSAHMGPLFFESPEKIKLPFDRTQFLKRIGCRAIFALTKREKEILQLLAHGYPASYIQQQLHLGLRTVENYIANIKEKLHCSSKVELIQIAQNIELTGFFKE